jgi:hypothetical protein
MAVYVPLMAAAADQVLHPVTGLPDDRTATLLVRTRLDGRLSRSHIPGCGPGSDLQGPRPEHGSSGPARPSHYLSAAPWAP